MAIAMELTYPRPLGLVPAFVDQEYKQPPYTDLHTFRRVCKTFSIIGKSVWAKLAKHDSAYTTLRLPPRSHDILDLADVFLADGGALGKLVKTIRLTVYPSVHTVFSNETLAYEGSHWRSAAPMEWDIAVKERQERITANANVRGKFRMWPEQMRFVQAVMRVGCQAILDLVIRALTRVARLEIDIAQPDHHVVDMEEHNYDGSFAILRALARLPQITSMSFYHKYGLNEYRSRFGVDNSMLDLFQSCLRDTFFDTIFPTIKSLTISTTTCGENPYIGVIAAMGSLETLDLSVHEQVDQAQIAMEFLDEVNPLSPLKTLRIRHFDELQNTGGANSNTTRISNFLYRHRATLRSVELTGYIGHEDWIMHLVKTMRSELQLESCRVRLECDGLRSPELRQLLRDLAPLEIVPDEDGLMYEDCIPLDRYILSGKKLPDT